MVDCSESTSGVAPNQHPFPITAEINDQGQLNIGGCDVVDLVAEFGSPLYILDEQSLRTACRQIRAAFHQHYPGPFQVLYASKAWSCKAICAIVADEGLGIDVMSSGELLTALEAGVQPERLYFHGNHKSLAEQTLAVQTGCTIVVDNWLELQTLVKLAHDLKSIALSPVPILLRINPGIDCSTHAHIRTGQVDSKFGFDTSQIRDLFAFIRQHQGLSCRGLHAHLGSQIFELAPYQQLAELLVEWLAEAAQHGVPMSAINVGGGLGIRYRQVTPPSLSDWARAISDAVINACQTHQMPLPTLFCEPGRSLIGNAGVTAYTLGSRKQIPGVRTYVAVDGGMSDNPRPVTYGAEHTVVIANRMQEPLTETVTIAGKHCESGDILFRDVRLPTTAAGDVLVALGTGAYTYSQSSNYNRIPRSAAVLVSQGTAHLIIQRQTDADLLRHDRLPAHLHTQGLANHL